jgi:hypothetical protein
MRFLAKVSQFGRYVVFVRRSITVLGSVIDTLALAVEVSGVLVAKPRIELLDSTAKLCDFGLQFAHPVG